MNPEPPSFVRRWIIHPLLQQLRQGVTPQKLALTLALGAALGTFPILGSTTFLCLAAGVLLGLNQPILQSYNYLLYPAQIVLIPVFIRAGERLFGATPIPFSVKELTGRFFADPVLFLREFGMAGVHGITAWTLVAPPLAWAFYKVSLPLIERLARSLGPSPTESC